AAEPRPRAAAGPARTPPRGPREPALARVRPRTLRRGPRAAAPTAGGERRRPGSAARHPARADRRDRDRVARRARLLGPDAPSRGPDRLRELAGDHPDGGARALVPQRGDAVAGRHPGGRGRWLRAPTSTSRTGPTSAIASRSRP